ncbi:MerR family transcriptional regulator [Propionicimonas sp.]|jgi:DNA-binding transcriptional MerR regulator|uniref:transcriptional regulator FtsR n=1 Tax=Propionicimonas sp. TaxID=1955623 RepID=UPI0017C83820|nr:MerR family transcriptional regulator [Propionicimonas sp.]MBU3977296.1 MerR family transcriptional regulator [Actinomycetota bacterium]MBA3021221.1 MerR family transcriptional regulator [Propionicimonas sp.]MBU3985806.1 MerR family transcriptional regulator [Actinomycetota bacterium]MBU4008591.1 MerR family transcriptional regulator [Actinomycetota bacterium]MBU4066259.1 MerR family transcriptional regulator [Actinomycetota bacterium]
MALGLRSIGQVLAILKPDFDDISISKIRFLEAEGLISPERAPSGYRRYAESDIERLRYILDVQKHHYLPLKVIREHLDMMDRGQRPPAMTAAAAADPEEPLDQADGLTPHPRPPRRAIRVTRRELLDVSGLSEAALTELEKHQLVVPRRGTIYYGRDALTVAVVARKLSAYGMDARHLRVVKQAAEREVGLIEQAIAPHLRRNPAARALPAEVMQLVLHAHAAIMRSQLTQ